MTGKPMSARAKAFVYLCMGGTLAAVTRLRLEALLDGRHEALGILAGLAALGWLYMALREWKKVPPP